MLQPQDLSAEAEIRKMLVRNHRTAETLWFGSPWTSLSAVCSAVWISERVGASDCVDARRPTGGINAETNVVTLTTANTGAVNGPVLFGPAPSAKRFHSRASATTASAENGDEHRGGQPFVMSLGGSCRRADQPEHRYDQQDQSRPEEIVLHHDARVRLRRPGVIRRIVMRVSHHSSLHRRPSSKVPVTAPQPGEK